MEKALRRHCAAEKIRRERQAWAEGQRIRGIKADAYQFGFRAGQRAAVIERQAQMEAR